MVKIYMLPDVAVPEVTEPEVDDVAIEDEDEDDDTEEVVDDVAVQPRVEPIYLKKKKIRRIAKASVKVLWGHTMLICRAAILVCTKTVG